MTVVIDEKGYRLNVGIILLNRRGHVFLGRRIGQDAWQFPQGGVNEDESPQACLFRELKEEVGLDESDVTILGETSDWLSYRLPPQYIRRHASPKVLGQKQKWFLLRLVSSEQKIQLNLSDTPEFDSWRWVNYWQPSKEVIYFKKKVYRQALKELHRYAKPPRRRK